MTANWIDLCGEVCVVTGAGGGVGQAVARAFAAVGASVVLVDLSTTLTAPLAEELSEGGASAYAEPCDVSDSAAVADLMSRVGDKVAACSILVNNAAIMKPGPLADVSEADWNRLFEVNFHGYFNLARAVGHTMRENGKGALVHIASIAGNNPQPFSGAYSASKAAVLMMSRQLALEWGPKGVRSNTVSPGLIRTPLSEAFYADDDLRQRRENVVPLRRIARPEDVADAAVFLASPRAGYVNGQNIVIDGGFTQTLMSHIPRPGYE
jgi:NAD(P)-dependent dehydrogenase (short-subunit alcohol dehydrogenase family)